MKIDNQINRIILESLPKDAEVYLVGGYLRDLILRKDNYDLDYVLHGVNVINFAKDLSEKINGSFVLLDKGNEIVRVVLEDKVHYLDFARCVGKDIFEDLKRRDFSINSLAYDVKREKLIDIHGGIADIRAGLIRVFDEKNIMDDPLRILRAYRLASKLNFQIEENTNNIIIKNYKLINQNNIAKERIQVELLKLLSGENSADILQKMIESKIIYELFGELEAQANVPPNLHHHLSLINHSVETVRQIELLIKSEPEWVKEHIYKEVFLGVTRFAFLKLAALLHDIGKPETWTIENDSKGIERHRFIKHDEVGANMASAMLKRLKYSKIQIKYIKKLIKNHIYPSQLLHSDSSEKAILRLFRKIGEDTPDLLLLAKADRLAARGVEITEDVVFQNIRGLSFLFQKYRNSQDLLAPLPKLLDGREIMHILGITPGPELGNIIKEIKELQISGDIKTKLEAIDFLQRVKNKQK